VLALAAKDIESIIAPGRRKHAEPMPVAPRGRLPQGLSGKEQMRRELAPRRPPTAAHRSPAQFFLQFLTCAARRPRPSVSRAVAPRPRAERVRWVYVLRRLLQVVARIDFQQPHLIPKNASRKAR